MMSSDYLESDYAEPYWAWKQNPTPKLTSNLLRTIQPTIDKAVQAHSDVADPIIRSRARRMALDAVKTYDPKRGARLSTHIMGQLQSLRRVSRKRQQIISQPERIALERGHLETASSELEDLFGREPTTEELADHTGFSPKRIEYVRMFHPAVAEGFLAGQRTDESSEGIDAAVVQAPTNTWAELVYSDLDNINKKILEWSLGLHGSKMMSNQQIAQKLRLTPGAVTQRKQLIQSLLNQQDELGFF